MTDEQVERFIGAANSIAAAIDKLAVALSTPAEPREYEEHFDPDRDDSATDPEIIATLERMEEENGPVPDDVYAHYGLPIPDRTGSGEERQPLLIDESVFDLPQPGTYRADSVPEPPVISKKAL